MMAIQCMLVHSLVFYSRFGSELPTTPTLAHNPQYFTNKMLSLQDPHALNTDFALPSVPETEPAAAPSNHHNSPKKGSPGGGISDPDPLTKQISTQWCGNYWILCRWNMLLC